MTEENLEQTAVTEGAETTPGTETKKKTTRKKSSTGKLTLSNISQGSSQELHEMLPTGWQLPLGMQ